MCVNCLFGCLVVCVFVWFRVHCDFDFGSIIFFYSILHVLTTAQTGHRAAIVGEVPWRRRLSLLNQNSDVFLLKYFFPV